MQAMAASTTFAGVDSSDADAFPLAFGFDFPLPFALVRVGLRRAGIDQILVRAIAFAT
jgi:hypothetical protein